MRMRAVLTGVVAIYLVSLGLALGQAQSTESHAPDGWWFPRSFGPDGERILRGYQIAPVPLNLKGKDPALVGLGAYIVNASGGCNDCHTNPPYASGGDPYAGEQKKINVVGYLAGGQQFGPFVSSNITPDAQGRPAGLTWHEFRRLMRTGRDPDNPTMLLQVMPWPVYGEMTDRDLRAVYEYLRAVPSITTP